MVMLPSIILAGLVSAAAPETAADAVTLRDGRVVLGQVVEPAPRGKLVVVVRRDWAEAHLADLARRWQAAEAPGLKRARDQRLMRLEAWRRERGPAAGRDDPIATWLDKEIARLKGNA